MKSVLISIQPKWCALIASGAKTLEIRKNKPKLETPFKCYIYCTKGYLSYPVANGMICHNNSGMCVIGEFVCDECSLLSKAHYGYIEQYGRVSKAELKKYMGLGEHRELEYSDGCYGWNISDLVIYDKPKKLSEFKGQCGNKLLALKRPPQSWCYVKERNRAEERKE